MKESLRPGVERVERITIDRDRTIDFMGEEARVYATPRLVSDIEYCCRNLILDHADTGRFGWDGNCAQASGPEPARNDRHDHSAGGRQAPLVLDGRQEGIAARAGECDGGILGGVGAVPGEGRGGGADGAGRHAPGC